MGKKKGNKKNILLIVQQEPPVQEEHPPAPIPAPVMNSTVRASHILAKHTGIPPVQLYHSSDRTNKQISISHQEAVAEMSSILEALTPENFADVARARSDCGS